jgi:hypothetical protein
LREEVRRTKDVKSEVEAGLQREIKELQRRGEEDRRRYQEELHNLEKKLILLANEKQRSE